MASSLLSSISQHCHMGDAVLNPWSLGIFLQCNNVQGSAVMHLIYTQPSTPYMLQALTALKATSGTQQTSVVELHKVEMLRA